MRKRCCFVRVERMFGRWWACLLYCGCPGVTFTEDAWPCSIRRDEAGLDRAVAMDGTNFLGRELRVGYAQPKQKE